MLLNRYRKTIWDDNAYEGKLTYYGILSNQAQLANRMGEVLYYTEKIDKLERAAHGNRPSISALTSRAGYYDQAGAPGKVIALYENAKDYINQIPERAKKESIGGKELAQAVIFLRFTSTAYYNLKQITNGEMIEKLIGQIAGIVEKEYGRNDSRMSMIYYPQIIATFDGAAARNDTGKQWQAIQQLEALRDNPTTPVYRKSFIDNSLNILKLTYFFTRQNHDSTARYLDIHGKEAEDIGKPYQLFEYQNYKAKELYNLGRFKESADTLRMAIKTLDSARSLVVQDVDNMLYARAEAEEKQLLLNDAEVRQKDTERKLLLSGVIFGVLLLAGIFIIRFIRHRQQARFLKFKLNLARNIHDEANPALLYAKALVRSQEMANESQKAELEKHIDHTMALIRSLSHDLRSDEQYTIAGLIDNTEELLQKLNADGGFSYAINRPPDDKRFISHYQYTELKAILNECISNTIKHAEFNHIDVDFKEQQNRLIITYKDNGKGWDSGRKREGIGVKNIEERAQNLNGEYKIINEYPNGYAIQVSVLLR